MSGTRRAKIGCYTLATDDNTSMQEIFASIYSFLSGNLNTTLKALYYGSGDVGDGNGTNPWYETNSFADGAYAVFTFNTSSLRDWTYDVCVQYTYAQYTSTPASAQPILTTTNNTTPKILISAATGDGNGDWWKGGTAAAGADAKANPVWGVATGGSYVTVLPARNRTGDTWASTKSGMVQYSTADIYREWDLFGDDDGFCFVYNEGVDQLNYANKQLMILYPFSPVSGSEVDRPLFMNHFFDYAMYMDGTLGDTAQGGMTSANGFRSATNKESTLTEVRHLYPLYNGSALWNNTTTDGRTILNQVQFRQIYETPNYYAGVMPPTYDDFFLYTQGRYNTCQSLDKQWLIIGADQTVGANIAIRWDGTTNYGVRYAPQGLDLVY